MKAREFMVLLRRRGVSERPGRRPIPRTRRPEPAPLPDRYDPDRPSVLWRLVPPGWQGPEHALQSSLIAVCRLKEGMEPRLRLLHAIPNGGARSKAVAGKLKAEGVRAGIPDLFLPACSRGFAGFYLELKAGSNRPSPEQTLIMSDLADAGYAVAITNDLDEASALLAWYLAPPP